MSSKPAAIPLFADAYMADTAHLTLEEDGAYLRLMMIAWRSDGCRLPDDDKRLARMLGVGLSKWAKLKPVIMAFWALENGYWTQGRLSKERKFVEEKVATNSAAAKARWNKQGVENKQSDGCERISERNAPPPSPPQERSDEVAKATPSPRAPVSKKFAMHVDWKPAPFPPDVADLVELWPDGRLLIEEADFRDYWIEDGTKRPGWDRSFRSRIRSIHPRIMRESRDGRNQQQRPNANGNNHVAPDGRAMGRTEAAARAVAARMAGPGKPGTGRAELIALPDTERAHRHVSG